MRCSVLRGEFKNEMVSFQDVPYFNTQNAVDLFACGGTEKTLSLMRSTVLCYVVLLCLCNVHIILFISR